MRIPRHDEINKANARAKVASQELTLPSLKQYLRQKSKNFFEHLQQNYNPQ